MARFNHLHFLPPTSFTDRYSHPSTAKDQQGLLRRPLLHTSQHKQIFDRTICMDREVSSTPLTSQQKGTPERNTPSHRSRTRTPPTFYQLKTTVSHIFRKTWHYRRAASKRLNSTKGKGYLIPGELRSTSSLRRSASHRSRRSVLSRRSLGSTRSQQTLKTLSINRSVHSIRRLGHTPYIFFTLPTSRGNRNHMLHRAQPEDNLSDIQGAGIQRVRYHHPSVTAIIPDSSWMLSTDNDSRVSLGRISKESVPHTVDLNQEFPGEVNVRKIARQSDLDLEQAKALVDGMPVRKNAVRETFLSVSSVNTDSTAPPEPVDARTPTEVENVDYFPFPALPQVSSSNDVSISQYQEHALGQLVGKQEGEASSSTVPPVLTSGHVQPRQSFLSDEELTSWYDDSDSEVVPGMQYMTKPRNSLNYIPYRSSFDPWNYKHSHKRSQLDSSTTPLTAQERAASYRHRQHYDSVERLVPPTVDEFEPSMTPAAPKIDLEAIDEVQPAKHDPFSTQTAKTITIKKRRPTSTNISNRYYADPDRTAKEAAKQSALPTQRVAQSAALIRPSLVATHNRGSVPSKHNMNDNGFPVFHHSQEVFTPKYHKRTLSYEEIKTERKEQKRKFRLSNQAMSGDTQSVKKNENSSSEKAVSRDRLLCGMKF